MTAIPKMPDELRVDMVREAKLRHRVNSPGSFSQPPESPVVTSEDLAIARVAEDHAWTYFKKWLLTAEGLTVATFMAWEAGAESRDAEVNGYQGNLEGYMKRVGAAKAKQTQLQEQLDATQTQRAALVEAGDALVNAMEAGMNSIVKDAWEAAIATVRDVDPEH